MYSPKIVFTLCLFSFALTHKLNTNTQNQQIESVPQATEPQVNSTQENVFLIHTTKSKEQIEFLLNQLEEEISDQNLEDENDDIHSKVEFKQKGVPNEIHKNKNQNAPLSDSQAQGKHINKQSKHLNNGFNTGNNHNIEQTIDQSEPINEQIEPVIIENNSQINNANENTPIEQPSEPVDQTVPTVEVVEDDNKEDVQTVNLAKKNKPHNQQGVQNLQNNQNNQDNQSNQQHELIIDVTADKVDLNDGTSTVPNKNNKNNKNNNNQVIKDKKNKHAKVLVQTDNVSSVLNENESNAKGTFIAIICLISFYLLLFALSKYFKDIKRYAIKKYRAMTTHKKKYDYDDYFESLAPVDV